MGPQTFLTKADAKGRLTRRREDIVSGEWTAPVKMPAKPAELSFEVYSRQWLQERDLKPRTREGYAQLLRNYLMPVLGRLTLEKIKPTTVRAWYARLPPDEPTTRVRSYALLKTIMNTAVTDELLDHNPCRIRGASNTPRAKGVRPASLDELDDIVAAMPTRHRALVLLCAWCAGPVPLRRRHHTPRMSGRHRQFRRRELPTPAARPRR